MRIKKLLKDIKPIDLLGFIEGYAARDEKFANALEVRFAVPDFDPELRKIEQRIDAVISDSDAYDYSRGGWGYISVDTDDIYAEIDTRINQGYVKLAFAACEILYRKLLDIFEYQAECEIADEVEALLKKMADIAKKITDPAEEAYVFEQCLLLADLDKGKDYGADYEDKLLTIAAQFVIAENRAEIERMLKQYDTGWRGDEFKVIRLNICKKLDGKKAAEQFIADNLESAAIRAIAYDNAMRRKNYDEAERLCKTAPRPERAWGVSDWLYKLYAVYEQTDNATGLAETAEQILFAGNDDYYAKLRGHMRKLGIWKTEYPKLRTRCAEKLRYQSYMKILNTESELALLLEQLCQHTDEIYTYGKRLSKKYRVEIRTIFSEKTNAEAAAARDRKAYHQVCNHIQIFAQAGYKTEVKELIAALLIENKRRPAFVDELCKMSCI